jgi:hypothetical protein
MVKMILTEINLTVNSTNSTRNLLLKTLCSRQVEFCVHSLAVVRVFLWMKAVTKYAVPLDVV